MVAEDRDDRDRSATGVALGVDLVLDRIPRAQHVELVAGQIDVVDAKRPQLTAPQAGVERRRPQSPLLDGKRLEVVERLTRREDPAAPSPRSRQLDIDGGVMSDARLRLAGIALAVAGTGISAYLTWVHYEDRAPVCVGGGCEQVQNSEYAELGGVPVALIGLVGYIALIVAFALPGEIASVAAVLGSLAGFGFAGYLTYLELFVIDAICQWCVASAVVITALAVIAIARYVRAERGPPADADPDGATWTGS
jgi:uncharacterized membrane protein